MPGKKAVISVFTLLSVLLPVALSGCGNPFEFDPATTVILKVTGIDDQDEKDRIKEKAVELVLENSTWHKSQVSEHAKTVMVKVSPVEDVQDYADRIKFGRVTSVDERTIHVEVE